MAIMTIVQKGYKKFRQLNANNCDKMIDFWVMLKDKNLFLELRQEWRARKLV